MADRRVSPELRERLIRETAEGLVATGMSARDAREAATQMFEEALRLSQKSGPIGIAPGSADRILAEKDSDPEARATYHKLRAEGVNDEDIRAWSRLSEIERHMLFIQDTASHAGVMSYYMDQGAREDEALQRVRKAYPVYGDPDDTTRGTGDDRPLPPELKFRVMRFAEEAAVDPEGFRGRARSCSSFNAFVRSEMRAGRFPVADSGRPPAAAAPPAPYQSGTRPGCLLSLFAFCWQALGGR